MNFSMILLILTHLIAFALGGVFMFMFKASKNPPHTAPSSNYNSQNIVNGTNPSCDDKKDAGYGNYRPESKLRQGDKKNIQSCTLERKPSRKELQRQQRKEERAKRRQEEVARKVALEEQERKQSFNPRMTKPENVVYTNMAVSEGHLVPHTVGQTYYYHSWEYDGRYFFEFYCDQSKMTKAINNRSVLLEPFCQKEANSASVDEAKSVEIIEYGEIDKEFNIISKSVIRFK